MRNDMKILAFISVFTATIFAAFCLGMCVMWSWTNPIHTQVWTDGDFYYVETPDGNIWMHNMEEVGLWN